MPCRAVQGRTTDYILAQYDPPFRVLGRHNEIMVPLQACHAGHRTRVALATRLVDLLIVIFIMAI
jgi:hypothetical protein